jgi:hypothetical protein
MRIQNNGISFTQTEYVKDQKPNDKNDGLTQKDKFTLSCPISGKEKELRETLLEIEANKSKIADYSQQIDKNKERLDICQSIMVGVSPMFCMTGALAAFIGGPTALAIGMVVASGAAGIASYIGEGYFASKMTDGMTKQNQVENDLEQLKAKASSLEK